jgi:hypothetical protein
MVTEVHSVKYVMNSLVSQFIVLHIVLLVGDQNSQVEIFLSHLLQIVLCGMQYVIYAVATGLEATKKCFRKLNVGAEITQYSS